MTSGAPRLFHVSEDPAIRRFKPRSAPSPDSGVRGLAVWAISESHLTNYLLPRNCPRICLRAGPQTTEADREMFLRGAERVVAFEAAWLDRVRTMAICLYDMPPEAFQEALPEAGYWISREPVVPTGMTMVRDGIAALADAGVEVRLLQDFWSLRDAVIASSLQFSIIRTAHAGPRRV